jgi:hypothetical protein
LLPNRDRRVRPRSRPRAPPSHPGRRSLVRHRKDRRSRRFRKPKLGKPHSKRKLPQPLDALKQSNSDSSSLSRLLRAYRQRRLGQPLPHQRHQRPQACQSGPRVLLESLLRHLQTSRRLLLRFRRRKRRGNNVQQQPPPRNRALYLLRLLAPAMLIWPARSLHLRLRVLQVRGRPLDRAARPRHQRQWSQHHKPCLGLLLLQRLA